MSKKDEIINIVDELLERYYIAESTVIDEFEFKDDGYQHTELDEDIKDYKKRIRELVEDSH